MCRCVSVCLEKRKGKLEKENLWIFFFYKAAVLRETLESLDATMW